MSNYCSTNFPPEHHLQTQRCVSSSFDLGYPVAICALQAPTNAIPVSPLLACWSTTAQALRHTIQTLNLTGHVRSVTRDVQQSLATFCSPMSQRGRLYGTLNKLRIPTRACLRQAPHSHQPQRTNTCHCRHGRVLNLSCLSYNTRSAQMLRHHHLMGLLGQPHPSE